MREVFHHLRFDLLRLRWWLLGWFAMAVYSGQRFSVGRVPLPSGPWLFGLVLFSLLLVRQHNLPGDRNWWVGRPIDRRSLALGKGMSMAVVSVLWLLGAWIHLVAEGFDPVAAAIFQVESLPLLLGIGLGVLYLVSLTKHWRELVGFLFVGILALLWISLGVESLLEKIGENPPLPRLRETLLEEYQAAVDFRAELGFLGGCLLCTGFLLVFLYRFRHRFRLLQAFALGLLAVAASVAAKSVVLPRPLDRIEAPALETRTDPIELRVSAEPGFWSRPFREDSAEWNLFLESDSNDGLDLCESLALPEALILEEASERIRDVPLAAQLEFGHLASAWKAWEIDGLPDLDRHGSLHFGLLPSHQIRLFSLGKGGALSLREAQSNSASIATVSRAEPWAMLAPRPGNSVARGIYRLEFSPYMDLPSTFRQRDRSQAATSPGIAELIPLAHLHELRFRLDRNPAIRWFPPSGGGEWRAFLVDQEGKPVSSQLEPLWRMGEGDLAGGPVEFAFAKPNDVRFEDLELAIVRFVPTRLQLVEIRFRESLPISKLPVPEPPAGQPSR